MDSAVIPLKRHGLSLIQSVDFFYPLVDCPIEMGRIAFANMASDIFATGVTILDKVTLILTVPIGFTEKERDIVVPLMISGFLDAGKEVGCKIRVSNLGQNEWIIIGGVVTSVCTQEEIILPTGAKDGDILVLTKPLGTQLATNTYHWMKDNSESWQKLNKIITEEEAINTYKSAVSSMGRLNKTGADLMHKYKAHAATDVTGFGLRGHAQNLLDFQIDQNLSFEIHTLPIIRNVPKIASELNKNVKLLNGEAVETSGGLFICLPSEEAAQNFCKEMEQITGFPSWIVGKCTKGSREVIFSNELNVLEVD